MVICCGSKLYIPIFTGPTLHVSSLLAADNHAGNGKTTGICFHWVAGSALGVWANPSSCG